MMIYIIIFDKNHESIKFYKKHNKKDWNLLLSILYIWWLTLKLLTKYKLYVSNNAYKYITNLIEYSVNIIDSENNQQNILVIWNITARKKV